MDIEIRRFVHRVRNRLREQCVIDNLIRFVCGGMLIATSISFISLWVPFYYAIPVASAVSVLSFFGGIIVGFVHTPTPMQAALKADAKGYQEKLSTALFLQGKEDAFSLLQKKDAMNMVKEFSVRKEFPLRLAWKRIGILFLLVGAFLISNMIDTPAKQRAVAKHDVKKEIKKEIARIEKVEKILEKEITENENELPEVQKQLESAKKELKEAQTYEELSRTKERINKKLEMASKEVKERNIREIVQQMTQEAEDLAREEKEKLAEEAKQALEKALNGSEKEKEEAYQKLKKLAEAAGSDQLMQMAEAYKESSYSDNAYANATQSLNEIMENMKASDYAQNNENSGKSATNTGNQNSNSANTMKNQENQTQRNNSQKDMEGNGNSNSGNGSGGNGGKNGAGSGAGWNYGGKEGQEGERKTQEDITIPEGEMGNDENLTGKANGNDNSTKQNANQSKTWSGNKVSYDEVSGEYKEKAYKKVNGSNYPSKMKDKIRKYFDGLN